MNRKQTTPSDLALGCIFWLVVLFVAWCTVVGIVQSIKWLLL